MFNVRRSKLVFLTPLVALALLSLAWLQLNRKTYRPQFPLINPLANDSTTPHPNTVSPGYQPGLIEFWDTLSQALIETAPKCSLPTEPIEAPINSFANVKKGFNYRPDLLKLPEQDVDDLRDAHSRFVAKLPELALHLPYAKGTKGIVTTASGDFVPILMVSLRMLRRTGSKLPVEVFMERDDEKTEICESILPKLNARCLILSEIFDAIPPKVEISRYQLKAFAMLFSSFDEILLLDADNLAMEQPEHLLSTEPFVSKGFVTWPDYVRPFTHLHSVNFANNDSKWANTASPHYYTISSQTTRSPGERASSESGQFLISKTLHTPTLLLLLYYNYYGPTHYYTLLSQGAMGQGDKETYLAAAMALNSSYYTVAMNVATLGFRFSDEHEFKGCGTVQHNPLLDYSFRELHNTTITEAAIKNAPSFIHAQTYKMDASQIGDTFGAEINMRMWGPKEGIMEKFGRDVEKEVWSETLYTGCQLENSFRAWENKTEVCKRIGRVYKFLFN